MMIEIRRIDAQHKSDINIPNEAFPVFGRIIPSFNNGHWTYKLERYHPENITEITFPNKDYVYEDMEDSVFLGAYDGEKCVGLVILQPGFFKYMYLYDLKEQTKGIRITPRENGQKCGVSRRAVNAVENNTHAPALSLAFSLARELQIRYLP